MKKISVYRPTSIEEAIQILSLHGTDAGVYAGGTDLLIRLKNRLKQVPTYLVDIKKIGNLRYIKETPQGGVQLGALTKLAEIAESDLLAKKYPMLVQAIKMISSPELRNASTLGGDLLQEVWCQYLRGAYSCWRNGGYICYGAIGDNSYYHSAMGGRLCYAVYPGDAGPALIALDATVKIAGPSGIKEMSVEQLVPGDMMVDGRIQSHVVRFNEILTEVVPSLARRSQPSVGVNLATLSAAKKPVSGTQKIISISKKLVFIMEMIFPTTKTIVSMNEKTDFVPEKIFPGTTSIGSRLKMIFFVFEKIFFTLETSFSGFEKIILRREKIFFVVKKIFSEATSANSLIRRAW